MLKVAGFWPCWADQWCGTEDRSGVTASAASLENTRVPFDTFKKRAEGKFTGNLESAYRNRNATGRKQPYKAAFNEDGTVNEPIFIEIAKRQGKWNQGADASTLTDAMAKWPSGNAKR